MLAFRVKNIVPPGGRYFYELKGLPLQDATRTGLRTQINQAYASSGEDVPADIWDRVQHFMCLRLPEGFCTGSADGDERAEVLTIQQVRKNTETLVAQSEMAPPAKAKFQAEICNKCPKNNRSICTTCSGISAWASRRVGRPDMPASYAYLGICEVDGTPLVAKINRTGLPANEEYPEGCWLYEGDD